MDNNVLVEALVALKPFLSKVEDNSVAISSIDNRLSLLMEEVGKLSRILYEGSGQQPPLISRMATLETNMGLIKDALADQKKEDRETVNKLINQINVIEKASAELGLVFDDYQDAEKDRREMAQARDLVHYGWRLNTIQAVLVLLLTSGVGFVSNEIYQALHPPKPEINNRQDTKPDIDPADPPSTKPKSTR